MDTVLDFLLLLFFRFFVVFFKTTKFFPLWFFLLRKYLRVFLRDHLTNVIFGNARRNVYKCRYLVIQCNATTVFQQLYE